MPYSRSCPYCFRLPSLMDVVDNPDYWDGWCTRNAAVKRLRQGCTLFVVQHDGINACFGWSECKYVHISWFDLRFSIPNNVVYNTFLYTVPEMRGKGIGSQLWYDMASYWKNKKYQYIFVVIDPNNSASLSLHKRLGYQLYQTVHYRRRFFLRCYHTVSARTGEQLRHLSLFHMPKHIWNTFWSLFFPMIFVCVTL